VKSAKTAWFDANLIAILLAINPKGLKGVTVKSQFGPVRDAWLGYLRLLTLSRGMQMLKAPANISAEQLLGALDIEASLQAGSLMMSKGLLERVEGNLLLLPMVERMDLQAIALISQNLDEKNTFDASAYFAVIALDESDSADEAISPRLLDRLAFELYLDQLSLADIRESLEVQVEDIDEAKRAYDAEQIRIADAERERIRLAGIEQKRLEDAAKKVIDDAKIADDKIKTDAAIELAKKTAQDLADAIAESALGTTDDLSEGSTNLYFTPQRVSYTHLQTSASDTWSISHDLGFYPNVTIQDLSGNIYEGEISYSTENSLVLTFSTPITGKAYLS
jgi:hypothetical protein